jgi:hypothetical protein
VIDGEGEGLVSTLRLRANDNRSGIAVATMLAHELLEVYCGTPTASCSRRGRSGRSPGCTGTATGSIASSTG